MDHLVGLCSVSCSHLFVAWQGLQACPCGWPRLPAIRAETQSAALPLLLRHSAAAATALPPFCCITAGAAAATYGAGAGAAAVGLLLIEFLGCFKLRLWPVCPPAAVQPVWGWPGSKSSACCSSAIALGCFAAYGTAAVAVSVTPSAACAALASASATCCTAFTRTLQSSREAHPGSWSGGCYVPMWRRPVDAKAIHGYCARDCLCRAQAGLLCCSNLLRGAVKAVRHSQQHLAHTAHAA